MRSSRWWVAAACVVGGFFAQPQPAQAGAWVQAPGQFYLKVWARSLYGSNAYTADGSAQGIPRYQDHQLNLYGEAGVTEQLTVLASLTPIGFASINGERTAYVGPILTGLRLALLQGDVPLALEVHYGVEPGVGRRLYDEVHVDGEGVGRRVVYDPAIYNHRGEFQLQVGRGFRVRRSDAWFVGSAGVRVNSHYREALVAFLQVGVKPGRFTIDLHAQLVEPFFADLTTSNVPGVGDTRYLGFGLTVAVAVTDRFAINAGFGGVLYAQSNAATPSLELGIEFH